MSGGNSEQPTFVLLVEDEVILRMHAADFLEDEGFIVIESTNGEQEMPYGSRFLAKPYAANIVVRHIHELVGRAS